jgi:cytochrome c
MKAPRLRFRLEPALAGAALFALTLGGPLAAPRDAPQTDTGCSSCSALASTAHTGGDAARGEDIFKQNCSMCHSPEPGRNMVGPSLFSVLGRPAASVAGFSYSSAMKSSRVVWTSEELMAYLKAPRKYMPGAKMMFSGLADQRDRENVVAFLATLGAAGDGSTSSAAQLKTAQASD